MALLDRIKKILDKRSGIISVILVVMLALASLNYYVLANSVNITIMDDGKVTSLDSSVATVEDILASQDIKLDGQDAVTPALDIKLIADAKIEINRAKKVWLYADDSVKSFTTTAANVAELFKEQDISIISQDRVSPSLLTRLTDGMEITIERAFAISVTDGTVNRVVYSCEDTVKNVLAKNGIVLHSLDTVHPSLDSVVTPTTPIVINRVTVETFDQLLPAEYGQDFVPNADMAVGTSKSVSPGINGQKLVRTFVYYENGVEYSRFCEEEIMIAPKNEVVEYGTQPATTTTFWEMNGSIVPTITENTIAGYTYTQKLDYTATAYCDKGITKSGVPSRVGVVAVDPRVIPLGSKLYITTADGSWTYGFAIAGDTGGAIKGNIVDLFFNTYNECIQFGRRKCVVYVLA